MSSRTFVSVSLLSFFIAACGGGTSSGTGGAGTTSTSTGTGGSTSSTSSSSGTGSSTSSTSSSSGTGGSTPITSCDDIGATECFSNYDCASASDRCETETDVLACCAAGARGAGKGGDPCQSPYDCQTGICVEDEPAPGMNSCSQLCDTDADCPSEVPKCVTLVAGANGSFCL